MIKMSVIRMVRGRHSLLASEQSAGECLIRLRASHHPLPHLQSQVILQEAPGVGERRDGWGVQARQPRGYQSRGTHLTSDPYLPEPRAPDQDSDDKRSQHGYLL